MLMNISIEEELIEILLDAQEDSGYFPTYMYNGVEQEKGWYYIDNSPFLQANILVALSSINNKNNTIDIVIKKGFSYLKSKKKSTLDLWRFWDWNVELPKIMYDLDDTAICSYLFEKQGLTLNNKYLFTLSRDKYGYFKTWFVPSLKLFLKEPSLYFLLLKEYLGCWKTIWLYRFFSIQDKEPAVASNAILYLGDTPISRPCIDAIIAEVKSNHPVLKFYQHQEVLYYHITRAYHAGVKRFGLLRDYFGKYFENKDPKLDYENVLLQAMALIVMIRFKLDRQLITTNYNHIVQRIDQKEHLEIYPYFVGGFRRIARFGSKSFTAAIILEGLNLYHHITTTKEYEPNF